ncbi:MAG TPA: DMT family transporter [Candidatus Saccharimonadales bacterium]|nr:DMT family transporter [Candidatus Saccharimonadales bacterium]
MWFFLALSAGFLFATDRLIIRSVFKKNTDPLAFGALHELLAGLFLIPVALFDLRLPQTNEAWLYLVLVGIFIFLADATSFLSLKNTEASMYQIAQQSRHVVILIGAYFAFGEAITTSKILSILLIVFGVSFALIDRSKLKISRGIVYAALSAVFISGAFLVIKKIGGSISPSVSGVFGFLVAGFLIFILYLLKGGKKENIMPKNNIKQLLLGSITFSLFELCLFTSLTLGEASRVTPVTQSSLIFTLIGGYFFLGERTRLKQKIIGSVLIILGIGMLYFI